MTYQTSRLVKHLHLPQGTVKRQSVSVLIDQEVKWEKQGNQMQATMVPPTPEKMKMIRDLVAGVIGLNETRGDQLTLETLPFETTRNAGPPAANNAPRGGGPGGTANQSPLDKLGLPKNVVIGIGGGALLLLVGGVVFALKKKKAPRAAATSNAALPGGADGGALPGGGGGDRVADTGQRQLGAGKVEMNTLVSQVRDAAKKDADTYAEVLQNWLVEEKAAR